ncbi:MAG: group II intron reverse transcriptase/maturase [Nitrospirota bacterium]
MTGQADEGLAGVSEGAKQAGDSRARWAWAEPTVWTDRMLAALENGVKGGKWFSLIDKVHARRNLAAAFGKVKRNQGAAGVDHQTVAMYEENLEKNLEELEERLREGNYEPQAIRRHWIPKAGSKEKRPLGIPTVQDRVVQTALRHVLEPIFERDFAEQSYGFRPKRGCKDALRRVDELLKAGHTQVVDADLKSYFDKIPHELLMERVGEKVADGRVLGLIRAYLNQEVLGEMNEWEAEGTPQGAVISPLLSNVYLDELDRLMAKNGFQMVRYADDFVILCRSREEAQEALRQVQEWVGRAKLVLHPEKTRIVDATREGFEFLGYRFERGQRGPRNKSVQKFRDTIREKTKRCNGSSLTMIIADVNRTTRGWFEYFKHSQRRYLTWQDAWMRMRLRSILRKRERRTGQGRGYDHQRWPNSFFIEQGLFTMTIAHAGLRQPA